MKRFSLACGLVVLTACSSGGLSSSGAEPATESALATRSADDLLKIAKRAKWFGKGKLADVGSEDTLKAQDFDGDGKAGYHAYTAKWGEDAIGSYNVVADFEPALVIKTRDCLGCTNLVVGKKRGDGKYEIKQATPKHGTVDGPIVGDGTEFEDVVFITSVENLNASSDPHTIAKSVTNGSYKLEAENLE